MRREASLSPAYFENMFSANPDPWRFETSAYERAKYAHTVAALGGRRYERALEIGCANGVLTKLLAPHALRLLAVDVSETALSAARRRCAPYVDIVFERLVFPAEAPVGWFDLIVMSEVVYYWSDRDIASAGRWIDNALRPGGDLVLVHWTGDTDYPQSGDEAVEKLAHAIGARLAMAMSERTEKYRLDVWRRT